MPDREVFPPLSSVKRWEMLNPNTGSSLLGTLTASASSWGSWTQLEASTSDDIYWLMPTLVGSGLPMYTQIAVGAASSEEVIIDSIPGYSWYANEEVNNPLLPIFIPKGSRIAARTRMYYYTNTIQVGLLAGYGGDHPVQGVAFPRKVQTYGVDPTSTSATFGATQVQGSASANTKGSWYQIEGSTPVDTHWCSLFVAAAAQAGTDRGLMVDIAKGAASSEEIILPDHWFGGGSKVDFSHNNWQSFPLYIPAGTRLSARCQSSVTSTNQNDVAIGMFCI